MHHETRHLPSSPVTLVASLQAGAAGPSRGPRWRLEAHAFRAGRTALLARPGSLTLAQLLDAEAREARRAGWWWRLGALAALAWAFFAGGAATSLTALTAGAGASAAGSAWGSAWSLALEVLLEAAAVVALGVAGLSVAWGEPRSAVRPAAAALAALASLTLLSPATPKRHKSE